jgi:hypothetical protein
MFWLDNLDGFLVPLPHSTSSWLIGARFLEKNESGMCDNASQTTKTDGSTTLALGIDLFERRSSSRRSMIRMVVCTDMIYLTGGLNAKRQRHNITQQNVLRNLRVAISDDCGLDRRGACDRFGSNRDWASSR